MIATLCHALKMVDDEDEEADADLDTSLEQLASFATALPVFPADVLQGLLQHPRAAIRLMGLDVLSQLDRELEMVPFLQDPDPEVRVFVLQQAWNVLPLEAIRTLATSDPDTEVR